MKKVFIADSGIQTEYSLKIFKYYVWISYHSENFGWFKLFGFGLSWKNINNVKLLFSERNGYCTGYIIKNWYIKFIKNNLYEL
jgi:hypothetical protein